MGQDSLPDRSNGTTIFAEHVNLFKRALSGDIVPRNASGDAEDSAGSIGSSLYKWLAAHVKNLYIYNGVRYTGLTRAAGGSDYSLTFPNALPATGEEKHLLVDENGALSFGGSSIQFGPDIDDSGDIFSVTDVSTTSFLSKGRLAIMGLAPLNPYDANQGVYLTQTGGPSFTGLGIAIRWYRNGVLFNGNTISFQNVSTLNPTGILPISMFNVVESSPVAGTNTYKFDAVPNPASGVTVRIRKCRMFYWEI